jgi:hypothetical protein
MLKRRVLTRKHELLEYLAKLLRDEQADHCGKQACLCPLINGNYVKEDEHIRR